MFNPYGVKMVKKEKNTNVNERDGQEFIDWMVSEKGKKAIEAFRLDGRQLFFPSAVGAGGS